MSVQTAEELAAVIRGVVDRLPPGEREAFEKALLARNTPEPEPAQPEYPQTDEGEEVLWEPHPGPQTWFLLSDVYELLYGGAAGGGKTDALLACLLEQTENGQFRGLFLRKTYKELSEVVDRTQQMWPKLGATYNKTDRIWTFPSGATIELGYMEDYKDTELYQGRQFTVICYDELGNLKDERCWTFLMSRNRATAPGLRKYMRASANPGGPGHAWVKRRFISICDKIGTPVEIPDPEGGTPLTRAFIQARVEDNPSLLKNDPMYIQRLNLLPEMQRKQLREGDWSAGEGMALDELNEHKHIVHPFEIPAHWVHFGAFDWGFSHPFAFGWFVSDEQGNVYLVDSVHGRQKQPHEIAQRIAERVPVEVLRYIHAGHDCWADVRARGESTPTIAETFAAFGIYLTQANVARVAGLNNLRRYVAWRGTVAIPDPRHPNDPTMTRYEDGEPRFRLFDTPGNRITYDCLASMTTDPRDREDALKRDADESGNDGDDPYDMVRYGLASRPMKAIVPEPPALGAWHPDVLKAEADYKRLVRGTPNRSDMRLLAELGDAMGGVW